ncbi:MAG: hypothetical protein GF308_21420 [Candidatus Heimdallarchaeota archaeon]|nr:hypothetical protein [Candidatus Heimdallarchaeota archaeon]
MINNRLKVMLLLYLCSSLIILPTLEINSKPLKIKNQDKSPDTWTLMLYFCADTRNSEVNYTTLDNSNNFLHSHMYSTMYNIPDDLATGADAEINIIALYDYPYQPSYPTGYAVMYELTKTSGVTQIADWGPTNMGDGDTLDDFVDYCKTNYPATNYALVLSDHGRAYAGFCYDYHAPHPSYMYALGDCLTVPELEAALSGTNNVDVIFFDTCSGGSFEVAWQLVGEADYMVAGETIQSGNALDHPREIAYALSRDVTMTPLELAQAGFDGASSPTVLSSHWGSISLYDLTKFDEGLYSPMEAFTDFTTNLCLEISHNNSMITYFQDLRNELDTYGLSTSGMLIDLTNLLETVIAHEEDFYYNDTVTAATNMLAYLNSSSSILVDEWHFTLSYDHLNGYSLCYPDSYDMYKGYMYGDMYDDLEISQDTSWDEFMDLLYPKIELDRFRLPDLFHLFIHPMDPVIQLHVLFDSIRYQETLHIGLNDEFFDEPGMGIEVGIPNAQYYDNLWGDAMISIPTQNLNLLNGRAGEATFKVIINASAASIPTQDVEFAIKHIQNDAVTWAFNETLAVDAGQVLTCHVSTNDTMTEIIDEAPPVTTTPPTTTPPVTTTPPTTTPTGTETGTLDKLTEFFQNNWLWFAIGGGGLFLIVVFGVILTRRRRRQK